ncbi:MAG: hypothetical protein ACM31C_32705 [Acidobacteriota bacterium]
MAEPEEDEIPKLPRGRGLKLSGPEIFRILLTFGMLVAILVLAKPCGDAVSKFVMHFDNGSAASAMPSIGSSRERSGAGQVDKPAPAPALGSDSQYVHLRPGMTDDEVKAAIEQAKRKQAAGSAVP